MSQGLTYTDAVKLLGGSGPLMKAADNLLGGVLAVATAGGSEAAISLFDAKTEAVRLGHLVAERITDVVRDQTRYNRSQRLHAAHGVLVVSSFFVSLDDCLETAGLANPAFTRDDQLRFLAAARSGGSWQSHLLDAGIPAPGPDRTGDRLRADLVDWFAARARHMAAHLTGLAAWDAADDRTRRAAEALLTGGLPEVAADRYEETVRRLVQDVPEFGIWLARLESRAVSRGLEGLESALLRATSHRDPARHRAALARIYRAELDEPILGGDAGELTMPSLAAAYLDPRFRVRPGAPGLRPADEDWWAGAEVRSDFAAFLATYLTTPQAAAVPLVLLGQPGGGKSSLTRILAARLPAADYLVVRVALREVRAEASVQDQIEQALRGTIGETVAWAELAGSADAAMPVILLDGLDELLQATGVHQSDYLERVAAFQRREGLLGRPAAVIVTSRVAVADRARIPAGGLVARLEPFDEPQVDRWLDFWNTANARYWAGTGRRPLTREVVLRFPDLASQPLLLLMLALHDAGANALQDAGDFDTGELYERLLHDFAAREVRRVHGTRLPEHERLARVEEELLRLSVVAFAMFHRLRLWVTTAELDADLTGLGLRPSGAGQTEGFQRAFSAGEEMVGRFFFIQRARAVQDDQTRQTYEFLHATFGEYLVARLVAQAVQEGVALSRARTVRLGSTEDDTLLQSLLGFTPLCARSTIVPFLRKLLTADSRDWLLDKLRAAVTRPSYTPSAYQPVDKRIDHWMATYSFNLTLLVLAGGGRVRASDLYRHARDPASWLRDTASQWRAAVPGGMLLDGLVAVQVTRSWTDDERRDLVLELSEAPAAAAVDPRWSNQFGPSWKFSGAGVTDSFSDNFPLVPALAMMDLSGAFSDDVLRHATDPILSGLGWPAMATFVEQESGAAESVAHALVRLLLVDRSAPAARAELLAAHERVAVALDRWGDGRTSPSFVRCSTVYLQTLVNDAVCFSALEVTRLLHRLTIAGAPQAALLLECLAGFWQRLDPSFLGFIGHAVTLARSDPGRLSPETCLRLLSVLPVTRSWGLGGLLDVLDRRLGDPDALERLAADPGFAARVEAGRARFDGYDRSFRGEPWRGEDAVAGPDRG
ncbi:NACHT domain-containing protein [Actinoplanes philippinensis]|uniref:NACHT domain-containing protein n=1 Tax=Actinoplanes philippinensis TaxID=35752 RepID=UPI003400933E